MPYISLAPRKMTTKYIDVVLSTISRGSNAIEMNGVSMMINKLGDSPRRGGSARSTEVNSKVNLRHT